MNKAVQNDVALALQDAGRTFEVTAPVKGEEKKPEALPIQSFKQTLYKLYPALKKEQIAVASEYKQRKYFFQDSYDKKIASNANLSMAEGLTQSQLMFSNINPQKSGVKRRVIKKF